MTKEELENQGYELKKYFHPNYNDRFGVSMFENNFEHRLIEIRDDKYNSTFFLNEKEMDDIVVNWRGKEE